MKISHCTKKRLIIDKLFRAICLLSIALCFFIILFIIGRIILDASVILKKPALKIENNLYKNQIIDEAFLINFIKRQNPKWHIDEVHKIYDNLFLIKSNTGEIYKKSYTKYTHIPLNFDVKKLLNGEKKDALLENFLNICQKNHLLENIFNWSFFYKKDSINPEIAGILTSFVGTLLVILIYVIFAVPLGICIAIFIVFFLKSKKIKHAILFNTFNLASLPPVVYGLISLFLFNYLLHIPRSSALLGGLTITLISFPHIIIISKNALKAVPREIFFASLALGTSKTKAIFDHMLPAALPKIFSGIMLGIIRVLSETAPLMIIGMVVFSPNITNSIFEPTNTITTQIFLWSKMRNEYFLYISSAAILVLIVIITLIKILSLWILKKFSHLNHDN